MPELTRVWTPPGQTAAETSQREGVASWWLVQMLHREPLSTLTAATKASLFLENTFYKVINMLIGSELETLSSLFSIEVSLCLRSTIMQCKGCTCRLWSSSTLGFPSSQQAMRPHIGKYSICGIYTTNCSTSQLSVLFSPCKFKLWPREPTNLQWLTSC